MPPHTAQQIVQRVAEKAAELQQAGRNAVILCNPQIRSALRRMIESALPTVAVVAYSEVVGGIQLEAVGMVGMNG